MYAFSDILWCAAKQIMMMIIIIISGGSIRIIATTMITMEMTTMPMMIMVMPIIIPWRTEKVRTIEKGVLQTLFSETKVPETA